MENRNRQYRRESYIDGNVVRQPERAPERRRQYEEKSPEQLRKERMRRNAARQNQQRALSMNRGYVAFLACATIESEIADMKSDNVAAEKRLETTMNLDQIKDAAIGLGLVMPGSDQVRYYSVENSDYMNQYGEIPTN